MNTEKFTGRAEAYAKARPGYPGEAIRYLCSLVSADAVWADIGAGTGIFTKLIAERGYTVYAVEPNADMRRQLAASLASFPNAKIVAGTAEATALPDRSADLITCAQALHWFDPEAFAKECRRIGKPGGLVAAVYNKTPGGSSISHCRQSTDAFFSHPEVREFPNTMFYTRENWLLYMNSHSGDPLPSDPRYAAHIEEANSLFDRENDGGLIRRDVVTAVYSERINGSGPGGGA